MKTLTYDQLVFIVGTPSVEYKRRNPGKVYAEVTTANPVDVISIGELRTMLNTIDKDIDVSLVFIPGTDNFPRYQIWIAASEPVMKELNQRCFRFRKQDKYLDMLQYVYNCQHHMNSAIGSAYCAINYKSLTITLGEVRNVATPFKLDLSVDEIEKLIDTIFKTGHDICKIDYESLSDGDFGFGFALRESESDKIYFKILNQDKWEVEIYSSVEHCHFLKVIDIAFPKWNMLKAKVNRDDADLQHYDLMPRIEKLEKYFKEHQKEIQQNKNPLSATVLSEIQNHKVQKLIERDINTACINYVSTSDVKRFINFIIERYGENMDIVREYQNLYSSLYIGELLDKETSRYSKCVVTCTPLSSDPDKWVVELYTADMIALFSIAVGKSIADLFFEQNNQQKLNPDHNMQAYIPSTDDDMITYDHVELGKALKLVDEISNLIKEGFPIDSNHTILNYPLVEETKAFCEFSINTYGPKIQIYRSDRLHENQDVSYRVTITSKECIFSDIAHRILGDPKFY